MKGKVEIKELGGQRRTIVHEFNTVKEAQQFAERQPYLGRVRRNLVTADGRVIKESYVEFSIVIQQGPVDFGFDD